MKQRKKAVSGLACVAAVCALTLAQALAAQEFNRGKALYENHCQGCHESWAHERAGRRVATLGELHQRVAGWSFHGGLDWTEDEISDVTDYLNVQFYQLTR